MPLADTAVAFGLATGSSNALKLGGLTHSGTEAAIDDEACWVDGDVKVDMLGQLPFEVALYTLLFLDLPDVLTCTLVSRTWNKLALDNVVWRDLFHRRGWALRKDALAVASVNPMAGSSRRSSSSLETAFTTPDSKPSVNTWSGAFTGRLRRMTDLLLPEIASLSFSPLGGRSRISTGADVPSPSPSTRGFNNSRPAESFRYLFTSSPAVLNDSPPPPPISLSHSPSSSTISTLSETDPALSLPPPVQPPSTGWSTPARRATQRSSPQAPSVSPSSAALSSFSPIPSPLLRKSPKASLKLNWPYLFRHRFLLEKRWWDNGEGYRGDADGPIGAATPEEGAGALRVDTTRPTTIRTSRPGGASSNRTTSIGFEPKERYLDGHTDSVYCVRLDATGSRLITGSRDRTIKVWDVMTGECLDTLEAHTASVLCLQFDEQLMVSGSSDSRCLAWDMKRKVVVAELEGHASGVLDVAFNDDWVVSCSKDATVRVWRRKAVSAWSPDSLGGSGTASMPTRPGSFDNPLAPVFSRVFKAHQGPVNAASIQGDKVVSASGDGSMMLWDASTGEVLYTFVGHNRGLACLSFRGDLVVSGSNDLTLKLWRATKVCAAADEDEDCLGRCDQHGLTSLPPAPPVATTTATTATTAACLRTFHGHLALVRAVDFDSRRGLIVSGGYDRSIKVWDMRTGCRIRDFGRGHSKYVFDVQFDANRIVSTCQDGRILVRDFGGDGLDTTLFV